MRPTLLAALVANTLGAPSPGQEPEMVCLRTFGVAVVEGAKETTVTFEYLSRHVAEKRMAARPSTTGMSDVSGVYTTNEEEKAACEAGL